MTHVPRTLAVWLVVPLLLASFGCSPSTPAEPDAKSTGGEGPRINWDRPFGDGIDIAPSQSTDAAAIQQTGSLSFTPIVPKFAVPPTLVQVTPVSDPVELRGVVFAYKFPLGPDFPTDGRVTVLEQFGFTPSDLLNLEQANASEFRGRVSLISVGPNISAELKTNNGISGVVMSLSGSVWVDIAGPFIPPDTATKLAQTFG